MDSDPERGAAGRHDGGDNITYGEGRWGRHIGETKNGILERWWFYFCDLTYFSEALRNFFRTMATKDLLGLYVEISVSDLLAEHALYTQSNGMLPSCGFHKIWRYVNWLHAGHRCLVSCGLDNLLHFCN